MRTKLLAVVVLAGMSAFGADYDRTVWRAVTHGAEFDTLFKVVDDEGSPVADARCSGWMYIERAPKQGRHYSLHTDTNGFVRVTGKCGEWFSVVLRREGYYRTMFDMKYPDKKNVPAIVDGKWQPYGETRTVVLKKIKNPIRLRDPDARARHKYPESGKWVGFDLEVCDWVSPLGNGKYADMMVRYARSPRTDGYFKSLDVAFTNNPYAGVYLLYKDSYSEMDSVYEANTNGEYVSTLRYEFERTAKGNHLISELGKGQYLVFRTRTKVDRDGKLISAHYGRIMGCWDYVETGNMILRSYFNPTPNDTNLEDAETARKSRLGYKQQLEFEQRRKVGVK